MEARLAALEGRGDTLNGTSKDHAGAGASRPPALHTASGHLMLHSWPRLRVSLTEPDFDPLRFLREADAADISPGEDALDKMGPLTVLDATRVIDLVYQPEQPTIIDFLIRSFEYFHEDRIVEYFGDFSAQDLVPWRELPIPQLLIFSIVLCRHARATESRQWKVTAAACLRLAMESQGALVTATLEGAVMKLVTAYCLVHFWARPFHALGYLQSVNATIKRCAARRLEDPSVNAHLRLP